MNNRQDETKVSHPDQDLFVERLKQMVRSDPNALVPSDLPSTAPSTPEEELARLIRNNEEIKAILRVCEDAGYYGQSSLVEFIKERIK